METIITYRRRSVTKKDIANITRIIAAHPDKSRRFISQEVCRVWDWRQPNGVLKDMACRSLLLLLESKGFIKLPPRKGTRSIKGQKSCERLWTVIATCALQGRSAFNFILKAVKAYFQDQPSPSLLPDPL